MFSSLSKMFENLGRRSLFSLKQAVEAFETPGAQGTLVIRVVNGKVEVAWSTDLTYQVQDPWARVGR